MKTELEEAAERYVKINVAKNAAKLMYKEHFIAGAKWQQEQHKIDTDDAYSEGFENGKNWQQERSYSEEEVLDILTKFWQFSTIHTRKENLINWFEQFKKK